VKDDVVAVEVGLVTRLIPNLIVLPEVSPLAKPSFNVRIPEVTSQVALAPTFVISDVQVPADLVVAETVLGKVTVIAAPEGKE